MALFKFRKGGDEPATTATQPESVEVLRRRAKNRLIGSVILVLIGVIGFPLLVDKQPRPVVVDLPIEIPDKNKALPLALPVQPVPQATGAVGAPPVEAAPAAAEVAPPVVSPKAVESASAKPIDKAPAKAAAPGKPAAKPTAKEADTHRYVIQVGAFAEEGRAREARVKLERAGLKTYTQVVDTKEGRRIRVRVGPFESKSEAERAAAKIRKLDLPVTLLTL